MAKKSKHLCAWKKDERVKKFDRYTSMVKKPRFVCGNCGRAAAKKKWLCEPMPLYGDK